MSTPVFQTRFGTGNGNCFAASVATVIGWPLELVDRLIELDKGAHWLDRLQETLGHQKKALVSINIENGYPISKIPDTLIVATGPNTKGGGPHAVVCKVENGSEFSLYHDPGGENLGIEKIKEIWFIVNLSK